MGTSRARPLPTASCHSSTAASPHISSLPLSASPSCLTNTRPRHCRLWTRQAPLWAVSAASALIRAAAVAIFAICAIPKQGGVFCFVGSKSGRRVYEVQV